MPEKNHGTKENVTPKVSRRQFLERLGITTGGALVAAVSLASACKPADPTDTITTPTTMPTTTPTTIPTTTPTTTPTTSLTTTPTTSPTTTPTTAPTTTSTTPSFTYTPPAEPPPLIKVPDSDCTIATDRLYSVEHTWIKLVSTDVVVMGITPSMVLILGDPYNMTLPQVGLELVKDRDVFSNIGGWKISADLYSPVSGEIIGVNMGLKPYLISDKILPIVDSAYVHGWIVAVQLSKPEELDALLTPQGYLERLGKK